jgi:leucine dehydrogenase
MNPLDHPDSDHELVTIRRDPATGLHAIIAIHDRTLGPAIGGCRILPYGTVDAALTDVLRLARGMTYKCAIGGIPYGGGKAVVIADPATDKTRALLHAMGDFVDTLGGRYITSYDSGTTLDDIRVIGERTAHVAGYAPGFDNASLSTAIGVMTCIETAWREAGNGSLGGARVAIQGLGNVGWRLADLLHAAGARLIVADVHPARVQEVVARTGAEVADAATIHGADVDIFAPCALGAILNARTIPELKARIIAGGANNQLATAEDATRLAERSILYCPDFLVNAGGIIELHHQRSGSNATALAAHLASLGDTLKAIITRAQAGSRTTVDIAERIAEERIAAAGKGA